MKQYIFPILILLFGLSSCKLGKHFEKPQMELPESLSIKQAPGDSSSIADLSWREIYPDSTLQALIERALVHNLSLIHI